MHVFHAELVLTVVPLEQSHRAIHSTISMLMFVFLAALAQAAALLELSTKVDRS